MRAALLTIAAALTLASPAAAASPGDDGAGGGSTTAGSNTPTIVWPRFAIRARTLRADRRGRVAVPVGCPSRTPAPRGCVGRVSLLSGKRIVARSARFVLARGTKTRVAARLGPSTRRRLARAGRLRLVLKASVEDLAPRRLLLTVVAP